MYLLGAEAEIEWEIGATPSVIEVADLNIVIVNPEGVEVFVDSPILPVDFSAPTELLPGSATYRFTPNIEGLWTVRLVTGTEISYTQLSKVDMQVLDSSTSTNPAAAFIKTQVTSEAVKVPCVVATTENIVLNGLQTINGVVLQQYDRVIVKDQTDLTENGLYNAMEGTWVRTADFNHEDNIFNGVFVLDLSEGVTHSARFVGEMDVGITQITFQAISIIDSPLADLIAQVGYGQEWAQNPEDTHVSPEAGGGTGPEDYSALHFAAKAYADAVIAQTHSAIAISNANSVVADKNLALDAATATQTLLANAGSMLGINFGAFSVIGGELIVEHISTSVPSLVDGELILDYETL